MFFAYNPTRPAAGQEVQFQDFSRGNPTSWLWDFGDSQTSILQNPRHAYTAPGSYKVILTARNNVSSGRVSRTLNVILSTSASFIYGPSYPVTGQAVQFTDTSTGGPTSWLWSFGDGTSSTSQNPSHTYTTAASYAVTLTVAFSTGSKTVSQTVTVTPALAASFTYSPNPPVAGQAVQFTDTSTGSPTSWQWSSGDGATSTSQNPSHTYTTAGSYTVTLTVGFSSGSKTMSQTITVLPPPALSASFTYSPSSPVAGQAVQFTDTSTGGPTSWLWNFGDNTTSTSKNPSHTYATAASYTVTLTVTNSSASKSVSQTITVSPASTFIASFTYSPSSPAAGQVVYFTDTSTGNPTSWQWNFGDGTTSTTRNPSHSYATAATHTVTLTVTNSSGSKSTSQTVTVRLAFAASFTYNPSSPAIGQAVQFTDTSTGSPTSWQWNFGDNATSSVQNPSHTYSATGQNWVNLIITKGSDSQSTSQMITVREPGIIRAASASYADVSAAVSAAISGDTVIVPAGTATWTDHLIITKSIYLIGAGIGQTVITSNYTAPDPSYSINPEESLISFVPASPADNPPFRLSGMTINCASKCHGILLYNATRNICNKIRLDHLDIYGALWDLTRYGTVYGVMDNCTIHDRCANMGLHSYWTYTRYDFGGSDNFYYEDCSFVNTDDTIQDGNESPRYAVRHCSINGARDLFPLLDIHGNQASSGHASSQGVEIYENTITMGSYYVSLFDQRGGKAIFYNNLITSSSGASTKVREEENDNLMPPANNVVSGQPQHVSDSYYWGNRLNTSSIITAYVAGTVNYSGEIGLVPQENREFWNENPSFNGTTGIGVGPLANRPTTCTKGVAYWATDTKTLYRCTATNVWTEYYKPFTYPHPLRTILN